MAKGSGQQSSTLLGMAPLFISLFSAAFPPSFKTPVMSFAGCSSVCQCHSILCAGNVKHTLINLDSVLAAGSVCLQRWLSPDTPFECLPACPAGALVGLPCMAAGKAPAAFPLMYVSIIRILTCNGHLWKGNKNSLPPPSLQARLDLTAKEGYLWWSCLSSVLLGKSFLQQLPLRLKELLWKRVITHTKRGSSERQGCNNPVV